jgi:hypothetical protein
VGGRSLKEETADGSKAVKRMTSQEGKDMMTGNLEDGKTKSKMRFEIKVKMSTQRHRGKRREVGA